MSDPKKVSSTTGLEIAVIGMAGKFPGAENVGEYWENLKNGIESVSFFSVEELIQAGVDRSLIDNQSFVKAQGLIADPEYFDADFFGYTPAEAQKIDPQTRILHECVWQALEDSGYDPGTYDGLIGLFAGSATNTIWEAANILSSAGDFATVFGNSILMERDFLTTLISYKLDLRGPSMLIQTACSTSLVALHTACLHLLTRGCDIALAGGVTLSFPQSRGYLYQEGLTVSPDGHCRAFDAGAQGAVAGEGAGIVVLKRYEEALRDRDHIYAVIKGTGVNNDGSARVGFTAPSVNGQAQMLKSVYHLAGVDPETVGYIETHGTGTNLGDPVEIKALRSVFKASKRNYCAIGSVKTNIGHLNAAAGIAGFIKAVLAVYHRQIPPSLNFQTPNPEIDLVNSPFYVNRRLRDWPDNGGPLRAGVSSFGIGGANAHAILEEAPFSEVSPMGRKDQLLLLSAKTPAALETYTKQLVSYLEKYSTVNLADLAYTLQIGRAHFQYRRTVLCSGGQEAIVQLSKPETPSLTDTEQKTVVFMFPGEGSQFINIVKDLYQNETLFREEVDKCFKIINPMLPFDLKAIIYPDGSRVGDFKITDTSTAQPVLFIFEYALARLLMKLGIKPDAMIGSGSGEYVAACISGVFSPEDALSLLVNQGKLLQHSHTNHFQMMEQGLLLFEKRLQEINLKKPEIPFISTLTGRWITLQEATDRRYWDKCLRETAIFSEGITQSFQMDQTVFIEVGPGELLSNLIRQHPNYAQHIPVIQLFKHPGEEVSEESSLLQQLGLLWRSGLHIRWKELYQNQVRYRIPLPTYPFERQRYWIDEDPFAMLQNTAKSDSGLARERDLNHWLYLPAWTSSELLTRDIHNKDRHGMLFVDGNHLVAHFSERLQKELLLVTLVKPGLKFARLAEHNYTINPSDPQDYQRLVDDLIARDQLPELIGHLWNVGGIAGSDFDLELVKSKQEKGFYSLLYLVQALGNRSFQQNIELIVFADKLHRITGDEALDPAKSTILGPCRVIPLEYININSRSIDLLLPEPGSKLENELVEALIHEFCSPGDHEPTVAYRNGNRWTQTVRKVPAEFWEGLDPQQFENSKLLRKDGVYVITGGLGKMGLIFAGFLAETMGAKIVLIGQSGFPPREEWERWLAAHPPEEKTSQRIIKIREIEKNSPGVLVFEADLANSAGLEEVFQTAEELLGKIHGVIHAAGVTESDLLRELSMEKCERHFKAKIYGLLGLSQVTERRELDFVMLTSTLATLSPALGHGAYATANIFMDAFTQKFSRAKKTRWISIDWNAWDYKKNGDVGGQFIKDRVTKEFMDPAEGWRIWQRIQNLPPLNQVIISPGALDEFGRVKVKDNRKTSSKQSDFNKRSRMKAEYAPPETYLERVLIDIWQEVLRHEYIGVNDNFFDIGGNSLTLVQAHNLIKQRLQPELACKISLSTHFQYPTVSSFVKYLSPGKEDKTEALKRENLAKSKKALQRTLNLRKGNEDHGAK